MTQVRVTGLFVYPVKSARGTARSCALVESMGLADDRRYMVVRPDGRFLTQRSHPMLARLGVDAVAGGLALSVPGAPAVRVEETHCTVPLAVEVWGDAVAARDGGDAAAALLSEFVGEAARLAWLPPASAREADREFTHGRAVPVGFADGFPILVCNEASLADLNERLPAPIPMSRFRPNIVLGGLPAYAEDAIVEVSIGAVRLRLVKPCTRCTIPSIDQVTGLPGVDPAPVLKHYRQDPVLRGVTFGMNAIVTAGVGAEICVGDPVDVL